MDHRNFELIIGDWKYFFRISQDKFLLQMKTETTGVKNLFLIRASAVVVNLKHLYNNKRGMPHKMTPCIHSGRFNN